MKSTEIEKLLSGGDLRSIGKNKEIIRGVKDQAGFDEVFKFLYHRDNRFVLRAADAIEKISAAAPEYLDKHKMAILKLSSKVNEIGLQWHLALLLPRLKLTEQEFESAWTLLTHWALDKSNSRIVRVNSIQGLFEMIKLKKEKAGDFERLVATVESEQIPSLKARIRLLKQGVIYDSIIKRN
jgi:hypothetical protein